MAIPYPGDNETPSISTGGSRRSAAGTATGSRNGIRHSHREIADAGEVIRHGLQKDENGHLYAILAKGIFSIDPKTFAVKQLGSPGMYINAGGALLDGKLYFAADGVKIVEFELPGQ